MLDRVRGIRWIGGEDAIAGLAGIGEADIRPLPAGLEAEVALVRLEGKDYVLKIWNRASKPDIGFQYRLLKTMYGRGLPVSRPLGWGMDPSGHHVLLTSFDCTAVREEDADKLHRIAGMLLDVHRQHIDDPVLPRYDFVTYFFPGIDAHPDLAGELKRLVEVARPRQDTVIHGDYNFDNILVTKDGRLTIIDWTNAQWGGARYDIAWSVFLADLNANDALAAKYRLAYLNGGGYSAEELEPFEAMAMIRWMLLDRTAGMLRMKTTDERLRRIMETNRFIRPEELAWNCPNN